MLKSLRLENFKGFKDAELSLGDLTVLVGTNASGKSNIRDAFRFLHGISRGYSIADIIGGKYEDGVQQWQGIRGGTKEIVYRVANSFAISISFSVDNGDQKSELKYFIQLGLDTTHNPFPYIKKEYLYCSQETDPIFESSFNFNHPVYPNSSQIHFLDYLGDYTLDIETDEHPVYDYLANHIPVLAQVAKGAKPYGEMDREQFSHSIAKRFCEIALNAISEMRFLDLSPDVMRLPTFAGQNVLGDRGENLSSVMLDICRDETRKAILLDWLQALTPMDAQDFDFPEDFTGKVLLRLIEASGQKTTAYSASDGTLRFLGLLAALLGNQRSRFYFFEEPENGIYPNRPLAEPFS